MGGFAPLCPPAGALPLATPLGEDPHTPLPSTISFKPAIIKSSDKAVYLL